MRLLITGSRNWTDEKRIHWALTKVFKKYGTNVILISGHCPTGADKLCEIFAKQIGWEIETHPADWNTYGRRAGFLRNKAMVDSEPDYVIGFLKGESKGTKMCLDLAKKKNLRIKVFQEN